MKNQTKITVIIATLLVILLGGYVYYDTKTGIKIDAINTKNATTTKEISAVLGENGVLVEGGNVTIEQIPAVSVPMPDYKKPIVFSPDATEDFKKIMTERINRNITDLDKNNNSFEAWIDLGINRKMINDFEGAVEVWEYVNIIRPDNIVSFNNLGNLYHYELKDYVKAEENFLKAIENDKNYIISYTNLADLYRFSYKTDTNSAEKILLEGLKNNSNDISLFIALASYYKEKGDVNNAIVYYKKSLEQAKLLDNSALVTQIQNELNNLTQ